MAAFDPATLDRWRALAIVDRNGTTVGTISEFYLDRETGYPTWALVDTGLFGGNQTFVPLVHATEIDDGLRVPYEKRHIKDAPRVDLHDELTPDEEATLFGHYGVDYQPSPVAGSPAGSVEGSEPDAVPAEPGSVEGPGPVPAEPGSVEGPGPVPAEPRSVEGPGGLPGEPESIDGPGGRSDGRGPVEGPRPLAADPGSAEDPGTMPAEPGPVEHRGAGPAAGTAEADEVTQVTPGGFGLAEAHREHPAGQDPSRTAPDAHFDQSRPAWGDNDPDPSRAAPSDPDLSRTAPVAPGLPGSTAASTSGPIPTTIDKGAGPDQDARPVEEPLQGPDEPAWPPAGSFEEPTPEERPVAASDRWREAKLAAERERTARAAAAPPEERSPLERARRRLERLVGGGQDHDAEGISPAERDAAERARRARLGLDEDDRRR
jgi:PRC-barrel domain